LERSTQLIGRGAQFVVLPPAFSRQFTEAEARELKFTAAR
jgi:hypothetical protein